MTAPRRRLDAELARRGLVTSRQEAQAAIAGGRVLVRGAVAERSSRLVAATEPVELLGPPRRFVGRGGDKLDAALERFSVDVSGAVVLDAGSSTGGFTDCLLRRGAALVAAVDVGHGQLDARLRADRRVVVLERTNVRTLDVASLAASLGHDKVPVDVVTADLSFISLTATAPVLAGPVVREGGPLVLLVKPQFEVGRVEASRGRGVVREPELWLSALRAVASSLTAAGAAIMDAMRSPITGASGNTEFFVHAAAHAGAGGRTLSSETERLLRDALATAQR
jgi:23S rRNA (cytidine1920-2'-O)/16S rRNA (cytidine1409-2'-O)-methyltransferase